MLDVCASQDLRLSIGSGHFQFIRRDHPGSDPTQQRVSCQKGRGLSTVTNRVAAGASAETTTHAVVSELRARPGGVGVEKFSRIDQTARSARTFAAYHRLDLILRF